MAVAMQMAQAGKLYRQQVADGDTGRCISMKETVSFLFGVHSRRVLYHSVYPTSQTYTFVMRQLPLNKKTLRGIKEVPKWSRWGSLQAADQQQVRRAQRDTEAERGVEGYYPLDLRGVQ